MAPVSKEKVNAAYAAMENIGLPKASVTPVLKQLLKAYNNVWDFIEAENYRLLADQMFEAQHETPTVSHGPLTRAKSTSSGPAENSEDSLPASPRAQVDRGAAPRSDTGMVASSLTATTPTRGCSRSNFVIPPTLVVGLAAAVEYHSGANAVNREIGQNGHSVHPRGRLPRNNSAASPSSGKEKGKSKMVSGRENSRRAPDPPRSAPPPPPPPREDERGPLRLVTVNLDVCEDLAAAEGFEMVNFEKVNGVIIPMRRNTSNGVIATPVENEAGAVYKEVKLEEGTLDLSDTETGSEVYLEAPALVRVKREPPEEEDNAATPHALVRGNETEVLHVSPPHQNGDNREDVKPSLVDNIGETCEGINQGAHREVHPLEESLEGSGHLHLIPSTAPDAVKELPGADHSLTIPADLSVPRALKESVPEDAGLNCLMSLVDYDSEEEPVESIMPIAAKISDTCDLVLLSDESPEHVDRDLSENHNFVEIRPNYIRCCKEGPSSGPSSKRNLAEPEELVRSKRHRCAPSSGPVPTASARRKLIVSESPSPEEETDVIEARPSALKKVKIEPCLQDVRQEGSSPHEDENKQNATHDPSDISKGMEKVLIPFVNDYNSETITSKFKYIANNAVFQDAYINFSLARIGDEDHCGVCSGDCLTKPHSCACTREMGGEFAYTVDGLLKPEYIHYEMDRLQDPELKVKSMTYCQSAWDCPIERAKNDLAPDNCKGHPLRKFVKECWHKCGCGLKCGNRVVQRGISQRLQVFFTRDGKGWGLQTTEDLPAGTFVCEYVGEIITNMELDARNQEAKQAEWNLKSTDHKDTYPVLLDGDWCSERGLKDEEALCLDATNYGNCARFINHRCFDANLVDIPVTIESLDRHYYHVAFFTNRAVKAGEELTWDYKIDFDDNEHPIEAFVCLCASELCRGSRGKKKHKK